MIDKVIVIAEAGVNHNGSLERAMQMIEAAADAGADYIKFQTFKAEKLVNKFAAQADYQRKNIGSQESDSQLSMLRALELAQEDFVVLKDYCSQKGIGFLSSPFDMESLEFLLELGQDFIKIPSGEITNLPMLRRIAESGSSVVMSTGMSELHEIREALDVLYKGGLIPSQVALLHCNTEYPTPMRDVNLLAMLTLAAEFGVEVGYSDHTQGIEVPVAAVALGAGIIEKHFTLDKSLPGPDHVASLDPQELKWMISSIRNVSEALGSPEKRVSESERKNMAVARKSIVAKRDIKAGEVFNEENLTVKRPGSGISPMLWDEVLGQKAARDFGEDELIEL